MGVDGELDPPRGAFVGGGVRRKRMRGRTKLMVYVLAMVAPKANVEK